MRSKQRGAVLTLFATMVVIATPAHAQKNTRNFYNSHGAFAGTARTHGNATTITDSAVALSVALSTVATARRCTTSTATSPAVWCARSDRVLYRRRFGREFEKSRHRL